MQSPFTQPPVAPVPPKVLRPLQYCNYLVASREDFGTETYPCPIFAVTELEEMVFCATHAQTVYAGLAKEEVNLGG